MSKLLQMVREELHLWRALQLRAARNFRKPKHELWVILREVLAPELRELAKQIEQPAEQEVEP